jgi:hypothetical protein
LICIAGSTKIPVLRTSPPSCPSRDNNPTALCPVRPPQTANGRCWRTATNWDIAGERARPGCRFRRRAVVGMARCAVRRPALSCPRRAGRNSAGQKRESASGDIAAQCPYQSAVRRGIFVESKTKTIFSPVGAASFEYVAPTELMTKQSI